MLLKLSILFYLNFIDAYIKLDYVLNSTQKANYVTQTLLLLTFLQTFYYLNSIFYILSLQF